MLERVYRRVLLSSLITHVAIATDDSRVFDVAKAFGAEVFMTDASQVSGTDRVAEVASRFPDIPIVVNVQGDEPFIEPSAIDKAIVPLLEGSDLPVSTLKVALRDHMQALDPNVVKVVTDSAGRALYFSRALVPYPRDASKRPEVACFKHLGLYVYRRDFLLAFARLPRGPLEEAEKLEQLRVLENGYGIRVVETEHDSVGVDTEEDLERARAQAAAEELSAAHGG
jgi:3-deoxy-manno-octulosonate cytidylyltransferase (CMP-KDO synthetase)